MSAPERGRHRKPRKRTALWVFVALVALLGLLALGYFLAPSLIDLFATFRQSVSGDAPEADSPMSTITIDVRPDP